ncbi:MAG: alpha/beta hydrolase [Proteobacteria bacterium]|nr:alpha/beta hydrolase [Pseudomonadota bacterium]
MRTARTILWMLLLVGLAACTRQAPPPPAPAAPPPSVPAAGAVQPDGPRLVMSPDNVHIEYRVFGQGDTTVILIHGWACDANYWNMQLDALKGHYTVVAMNLAGHGGSGANRSDWSIANYAADVAAVARDVPGGHVVLVGHSMGATVALAAAPLLGARLSGIVAVDALRSVGLPPLPAREIDKRLAPFRADFVGETRKLVTDALFPRNADRALVQKIAYDMSLEPPAVAIASLQSLLAVDLTPLVAAIHVPVFAINSDLAPTDAARIRRSLPGFRLDLIEHTGDFPMLEAPAKFNALLLKDLAALSAPP